MTSRQKRMFVVLVPIALLVAIFWNSFSKDYIFPRNTLNNLVLSVSPTYAAKIFALAVSKMER